MAEDNNNKSVLDTTETDVEPETNKIHVIILEYISKMHIKYLKEYLSTWGLSYTGVKQILIDRLTIVINYNVAITDMVKIITLLPVERLNTERTPTTASG